MKPIPPNTTTKQLTMLLLPELSRNSDEWPEFADESTFTFAQTLIEDPFFAWLAFQVDELKGEFQHNNEVMVPFFPGPLRPDSWIFAAAPCSARLAIFNALPIFSESFLPRALVRQAIADTINQNKT